MLRSSVAGHERHQRRLPHWETPGETYFVTFCLARPPAADLTRPELAALVAQALHFWDGTRYDLYDYTVMPDHVHAIVRPRTEHGRSVPLARISHSLKGWTARAINAAVGRTGQLWQHEGHDHIIRNEADYLEKAAYILDNARRQGLADDPAAWPWWGRGKCGEGG